MTDYYNEDWQIFKLKRLPKKTTFVMEEEKRWIFLSPEPPIVIRSIVMKEDNPMSNLAFNDSLQNMATVERIKSISEEDEIKEEDTSEILREPENEEEEQNGGTGE